jgi:menaquinone-dependent protoporphyrinogen oxidase
VKEEQTMKVLVAVATKHGSTGEIAEAIAGELRAAGLEVDVRPAGSVFEIAGYRAVILGSSVYAGDWLADARRFARVYGPALQRVPVWLFSSGPIGGDDSKLLNDRPDVSELKNLTKAREHRMFPGKLDKQSLDRLEQYVTRVVEAPQGDFRDWDAIRAWARGIAGYLRVELYATEGGDH